MSHRNARTTFHGRMLIVTPQQAYLARPKATPTGTPLHTGAYRIRHDRIDSNGKLTLRHNSRLHHIGMGRRYAGTNVLILVHDLHIRITTTDGQLLRELHLDPTKDYQPTSQTVNDVPRHMCTMSRDNRKWCPRGDLNPHAH